MDSGNFGYENVMNFLGHVDFGDSPGFEAYRNFVRQKISLEVSKVRTFWGNVPPEKIIDYSLTRLEKVVGSKNVGEEVVKELFKEHEILSEILGKVVPIDDSPYVSHEQIEKFEELRKRYFG